MFSDWVPRDYEQTLTLEHPFARRVYKSFNHNLITNKKVVLSRKIYCSCLANYSNLDFTWVFQVFFYAYGDIASGIFGFEIRDIFRFDENAVVLVDAKKEPVATRIFGPLPRELKEKGFEKLMTMAEEIV